MRKSLLRSPTLFPYLNRRNIPISFTEFCSLYSPYNERFDVVLDTLQAYRVYDKYEAVLSIKMRNLLGKEAHMLKRCLNEEDKSYLREIYYYLVEAKEKTRLTNTHPVICITQ